MQVVRPMAFDQFDNAARVQRLGCGTVLRNDRQLVDQLQKLTTESNFQTAANEIASRFSPAANSAAELAAEEVDRQLLGSSN